jgi:heterodisulfide reductase subunit A-like polyferredoxin
MVRKTSIVISSTIAIDIHLQMISPIALMAAVAVLGTAHTAEAMTADVIVIGAGMAGMGAAARLKKNGISVVVLEAGSAVGGRAKTTTIRSGSTNVNVDLGAAWIHGEAQH